MEALTLAPRETWMQVSAPPAPPAPAAPVSIRTPHDLEVPLPYWLGTGVLLSAAVAAALLPFKTTFLGALLLDRGLTQLGSLYLASATLAFLGLKAFRVARGHVRLREAARGQPLPFGMDAEQARQVRDGWIRSGTAPALRRARALQAYMVAGTRAAAAATAEEDALFAQTAMEQSYSLPRTLVWAIPLMGFIGTVVGISAAVAGFSGFLAQAEEIEQIKTGIGAVTTGLAVAFDTTLLALALSVMVMLPLVLLERLEGRLLLALEADVSDAVVGRLPDGTAAPELGRAVLSEVVHEALTARLPAPQAMVEAAEAYLREAAAEVARGAREAAAQVAEAGNTLRVHQEQVLARLLAAEEQMEERMAARDADAAQSLAGMAAAAEQSGRATVAEVRTHAQQVATGLAQHAAAIAQSLDRVSATLQQRVDALERHSAGLAEVVDLERSLQRTLHTLEQTGELRSALAGVEGSLRGLRPAIERLNQPRRIVLVEADGAR
jgi:hypothetical protein